jgi:hypothetical protein
MKGGGGGLKGSWGGILAHGLWPTRCVGLGRNYGPQSSHSAPTSAAAWLPAVSRRPRWGETSGCSVSGAWSTCWVRGGGGGAHRASGQWRGKNSGSTTGFHRHCLRTVAGGELVESYSSMRSRGGEGRPTF